MFISAKTRRRFTTSGLCLAVALPVCLTAVLAFAQDTYPSKPVRLVVGFPPGGGIDLAARVFGSRLQEALNAPFVVDNRPGASGLLAAEFVAKSAPDGYTLLVGAAGQMTINPALFAKLPYDPIRDFAPVATLTQFPMVIAVHPSLPVKSLKELIGFARAHRGAVNYSHGGAAHQIAAEMLNQAAGTDMRSIPYKGGAPAVGATVAGEIPVTVVDTGAALAQIRAGRLRALAVTSAQRTPLMPGLPTVAESGFPGYAITIWSGLFAPAGTPGPVITRLGREVASAIDSPEMRDKLKGMGVDPGGIAGEQLTAMMRNDIARYAAIVKAANIRAE